MSQKNDLFTNSTKNVPLNEQLEFYLSSKNFTFKETINYPNSGKSLIFTKNEQAIIIDQNICECKNKEIFPYSLITNTQNKYMHNYQKLWRFLEEDFQKSFNFFISQNQERNDFKLSKNINREDSAETSPLEYFFEEQFKTVYGTESIKFLNKEYAINDDEGNSFFLDYLIQTNTGLLGVEENGISYHHPQIIGIEKYKNQLQKQNTCTAWGIKLFRFSTEDCKNENKIQDSIREYFGKNTSCFKENGLCVTRKIKLYEHQEITLGNIQKERKNGTKTFLVVFPTASGKSKIIEEDIKLFFNESAKNQQEFRALILAPNTNIISDWRKRISQNLPNLSNKIQTLSFAAVEHNYLDFQPNYFSYIVIDEAHHAVAPVLKRVIQYFTPSFLIGLTATDQRPDKKKLESVFGSYKTSLSLEDAMKKKIVASANVYRIETNIDLSKVRINGRDYINADLEKSIRVTSRNDLIANVLEEYFCDGKLKTSQGLIFCVNTDHTKEMEKVLLAHGISAKAYSSKETNHLKIMQDFKDKKIRFLCSCNMISEGWDYPELKILVMARPTLSKVLYLQQIGRGLRKTSTKENVFVIDVVDEYGAMANPCTMHSIFQNPYYVPFGDIAMRSFKAGDFITIDGLNERIERIVEVNISDFSQKYAEFLSVEQVAQDYFVSTETVNSWIKKGKIIPTVSFPFGGKKIHMFSKADTEKYKKELGIKNHDETTILQDFFDFLEMRDYTFSYKMPFLLSFLKNMDQTGDAKIEDVLFDFIKFYENRLNAKLSVERKNCPFTKDYISDKTKMRQNMLSNPFEKFERKRFLYYSKDLSIISMSTALFEQLDERKIKAVKNQMLLDMEHYFKNLGGLCKNDILVWYAKSSADIKYPIPEEDHLMVASSESGV